MRIPSSAMASRSHCPKIALRTVHLPTEAFSFRACRDSPPYEGFSNTLFYRCSFNSSRASPDGGKPPRFALSRAEPLSPKRKTFESRSSVCRHASETESLRPHCSMCELAKSPNGFRHPKRTEHIQWIPLVSSFHPLREPSFTCVDLNPFTRSSFMARRRNEMGCIERCNPSRFDSGSVVDAPTEVETSKEPVLRHLFRVPLSRDCR